MSLFKLNVIIDNDNGIGNGTLLHYSFIMPFIDSIFKVRAKMKNKILLIDIFYSTYSLLLKLTEY